MLIKPRVDENCKSCGHRIKTTQEEVYGCDNCGKEIDFNQENRNYIEITLFWNHKFSQRKQFCSWKCLFKKVRNIKTDYFISLPFLTFDSKEKGITAKDFWKCIK